MDELKDQLPETTDYRVGYFYGKQSGKRWLITQEDVDKCTKVERISSCCGLMHVLLSTKHPQKGLFCM